MRRALRTHLDGRFQHHLVVVGRVGDAQLECAAASEPLAFAHANISDEYAMLLPSGDPLLDAWKGRTFVGADVVRYRHGAGDLVLHPHGLLHWPGRLRPPYTWDAPLPVRTLSLVACCSRPRLPGGRPLGVTPGREDDVKVEGDEPAFLCDTRRHAPGVVGVVGDAVLELVVGEAAPPRGGYLIPLGGPPELLYLPAAARAEVDRGLLFHSAVADAEAPPWDDPLPPPFTPFEDAPPGELPLRLGDLTIVDAGPTSVAIDGVEVPRYWLARMLFRVALHGFRLGYVETYGGFFCADEPAGVALGVRDRLRVVAPRPAVETLYRAVAPAGYQERR